MQCVMLCTITFHPGGSRRSSLNITIRNEVALLEKHLGECEAKGDIKSIHHLPPDWLRPHFTLGTDGRLFCCTCVDQKRWPPGLWSWVWSFLLLVWRSCGTLKMKCYTSFWEFYSQNSIVLWNPHLNALHDSWKVRMLTPALQIDKPCPKFITGGLLEVR